MSVDEINYKFNGILYGIIGEAALLVNLVDQKVW